MPASFLYQTMGAVALVTALSLAVSTSNAFSSGPTNLYSSAATMVPPFHTI